MVLVTDLILLFSFQGTKYEKIAWRNPQAENPVTIARRSHLFPSRTQKLSSLAPMILGGKLPGKVGRCRFLFCKIFLQYRGKIAVMLSFFLLATSLLSESMVSFDPLCGIAARKETMKLAGLRLRVIWTLPVFYYLDLGKIERKNWARSVKRMRASFFIALMKDSLLTVFFLYGQNHAFDAWFRKRYTF